jgi:hypothetical protein
VASKDSTGTNYQLTVPLDTPLRFHISSQNLRITDETGAVMPTSTPSAAPVTAAGTPSSPAPVTFQHNSGDANPKSFQFTITGVNP